MNFTKLQERRSHPRHLLVLDVARSQPSQTSDDLSLARLSYLFDAAILRPSSKFLDPFLLVFARPKDLLRRTLGYPQELITTLESSGADPSPSPSTIVENEINDGSASGWRFAEGKKPLGAPSAAHNTYGRKRRDRLPMCDPHLSTFVRGTASGLFRSSDGPMTEVPKPAPFLRGLGLDEPISIE